MTMEKRLAMTQGGASISIVKEGIPSHLEFHCLCEERKRRSNLQTGGEPRLGDGWDEQDKIPLLF